MSKKECSECKWRYPDTILSPVFISGKYTKPVCGICARQLINLALHISLEKFQGTHAEQNREDAIAWRKKHPELNPSR